jgi:hypothetical protein
MQHEHYILNRKAYSSHGNTCIKRQKSQCNGCVGYPINRAHAINKSANLQNRRHRKRNCFSPHRDLHTQHLTHTGFQPSFMPHWVSILARIFSLCFPYTLMLPSKQKYSQQLYVSYITASFTDNPFTKKRKKPLPGEPFQSRTNRPEQVYGPTNAFTFHFLHNTSGQREEMQPKWHSYNELSILKNKKVPIIHSNLSLYV